MSSAIIRLKTVTTPKGTTLPLVNLKGKDYLMVGHRLQWFNETETNFRIETDFLLVNDDQTVARAVVTVFDKALARVNHKNVLTVFGILFINYNKTGGNASSVK